MTEIPDPPAGASLPVTAEQKVAQVLREHPALLDVFTAQSPALNRLRNPLMRKTFSRLVTVAQAAGVAGMPPEDLLRALNSALGVSAADIDAALAAVPVAPEMETVAHNGASDNGAQFERTGMDTKPDWLSQAPVVVELDARDMQRRGEDPFYTIMDSARSVEVGESLTLRNTFKPMPLLGVLGKKGFASWAEQLGPEDWLITFHRERTVADEVDADDAHPHGATRPVPPASSESVAPSAVVSTAPDSLPLGVPAASRASAEALLAAEEPPGEDQVDAVVTITPDDLTPPVPMQKVLEGLAPVAQGGLLLVHHLRTPPHLTAKLEEYGHAYRIWDLGPDRKEILIHKVGG
ncbi:MAG: DUF2249 domain-containing protein [Thermoleophilia bacterium]